MTTPDLSVAEGTMMLGCRKRGCGCGCLSGIITLLLIVVVGFILYDSNTRLVTDEYELSYAALPADFDGFRIVQLSDVHTAVFGKDNQRLIAAVEKAAPDIIAVTGDLVNAHADTDAELLIVRPLIEKLLTIAPVYYVTGNHEWDFDGRHALLELLESLGVTVLRNDYVLLTRGDASIVLAGVDDPNGPADMTTPEELLLEIREQTGDRFVALLAHRNNYLQRFAALDIDLVLCGHAHGGLIRLPFVGGLIGTELDLFPEYDEGLYEQSNTKMIVSRGLGGNAGHVPRFLNNPQIPVAILHAA